MEPLFNLLPGIREFDGFPFDVLLLLRFKTECVSQVFQGDSNRVTWVLTMSTLGRDVLPFQARDQITDVLPFRRWDDT